MRDSSAVNHQRELTQKHREREAREEAARREGRRRLAERELRGRSDLDLSLVIPDTLDPALGRRRTHRSTARYGDLAELPGLVEMASVEELGKRARTVFEESERAAEEEVPGLYRLTEEWVERREKEKEERERERKERKRREEATESEEESEEEEESAEMEEETTNSDSSTDSEEENNNNNDENENEEEEEEEEMWQIESTVEKPQVKMEEFDGWVVDVEDEERTESEKVSDCHV